MKGELLMRSTSTTITASLTHSQYYTLCSTLMNAFSSNTYAFIILEGYINMALIKDCIYLFDSHSRNVCGTLVH